MAPRPTNRIVLVPSRFGVTVTSEFSSSCIVPPAPPAYWVVVAVRRVWRTTAPRRSVHVFSVRGSRWVTVGVNPQVPAMGSRL